MYNMALKWNLKDENNAGKCRKSSDNNVLISPANITEKDLGQ